MKKINEGKRLAIGVYDLDEINNNKDNWFKKYTCRLVSFIHDNDLFETKKVIKKENRSIISVEVEELSKAKEYFNNDLEVLDFIDKCQNYDLWKTNCVNCDSITLNFIPYTYREHCGCVGKEYNCPICANA